VPRTTAARRIEPLAAHHQRESFASGVAELDDYLRHRAGQDERKDIAACYVLVAPPDEAIVRGYYTLSSYAIELGELAPAVARRLPRYPRVPAALLGRLAIDRSQQRRGLGELLLLDALHKARDVASRIGIHALVVDAWDPAAAAFYQRFGFIAFASAPWRLWLPMATIRKALRSR
jgi:GNAT superfamily N-acetyltransferase